MVPFSLVTSMPHLNISELLSFQPPQKSFEKIQTAKLTVPIVEPCCLWNLESDYNENKVKLILIILRKFD